MSTEKRVVVDDYHGRKVEDPYRWLEGSAAPEITEPEPELDAEVSDWIDAQNAATEAVLNGRPGRKDLEERIRKLLTVDEVGPPLMAADRYFHFERKGAESQSVVYVRTGHDGEPRALLDPNLMDSEGLTTVSWAVPSHDGRLLAFGMYRSGSEKDVLHVLDVHTGRWLADEIPGRVREPSWLPDGSGFFYHALEDLENPYSLQIRFHRLGRHPRHDEILVEQEKEGPLATTWGPFAYTSRDGRWMIVGYHTGTDSNDLDVVDLDAWRRTGEFVRVKIASGEKANFRGPVAGDTLFMHTSHEAPNGRVVAVDLNRPGKERWREIIPERTDEVLEGISLARGLLVASYLKDATTRFEIFETDGTPAGEVPLPGLGTAFIGTASDRTEAFFTFESFDTPRSIYRVELATGECGLWARPSIDVDPDAFEVTQVFYTSRDGTRVPMFLVHRTGLEKTGGSPVVLSGYGGFGISRTPMFAATTIPWLEDGGIYAVANLRGGGEYGEDWHRAGMLEKKQNVFDDFIAAGEWLIAEGYTSSERLAVLGGSNGGLLTGAMVTQRPDLYGAVVIAVPLLDMLRYQHFLMARYWVPEYGSSEDPEQFDYIYSYSPYHRVVEGTAYPSVFLLAGEHDLRVHPCHAMKMTARLREATSSDPEEKPILLHVDRSSGHGMGKPLSIRLRESADLWTFLRWQLGVESRA